MGDSQGNSDLDDRLDEIWRRTKPAVIDRIDTIERAAAAPAREDLGVARTEAHKLRGLLGTIGLANGSELSGRIEDELEQAVDQRAEPGWEARVGELATELRAEIEAR